MSGSGALYSGSGTSPYLASYPPRQDNSFDDTKHPYDDDIIQSYASAQVRLPQQQEPSYFPNRSPYMSPITEGRRQSQNLLFTQKNDSRMSSIDVESTVYDGGTIHGSSYNVKSVPEVTKPETTTLWERVRDSSSVTRCRVITVISTASSGLDGMPSLCSRCPNRNYRRHLNPTRSFLEGQGNTQWEL